MFTFGRNHERECAVRNLRSPAEAQRITDVVDAIHDLLEGKAQPETVRQIICRAFTEGGTGVWEQTGSWLRKSANRYPELRSVWHELSLSPDGKVRFRVACFINELPKPLALELGERLKDDRHAKTRKMAQSRLEEIET